MSTQRFLDYAVITEYWRRFANCISGGTTDWGFPLTGIQRVCCNERGQCNGKPGCHSVFYDVKLRSMYKYCSIICSKQIIFI
jgi:hypothetical protein